MKLSQIIASAAIGTALTLTASATVTFTGTAFLNVPNVSIGDVGVFIVDNSGNNFANFSIDIGDDILAASTYGNYTVLGFKTASALSTNVILSGAFSGIALDSNVTPGDKFAVVVFTNSTTTALSGDTWKVYTDSTWVIPADGSALSYAPSPTGSNLKQLGTSATTPFISGTVPAIPEPSSFAALAGMAALGAVASRRRRSV